MRTAPAPSTAGTRADGAGAPRAGAASTGAGGTGAGAAVVVAGAVRSSGRTSVPTPSVLSGSAKPQSSSRAAWSAARSGTFSVFITLTTSTRPSRSAAPTKVCRAASVKPVLPPSAPGYLPSSGSWFWIW
ncbi:hypothetical protein GCM10010531_02070 [Blastococcus jejuensis]|uniref:Uncharacterized protein n=1 Tax=Blastococcus jejuensis TaxID=351224 RepID=A0ABP6NQ79_9ACTN